MSDSLKSGIKSTLKKLGFIFGVLFVVLAVTIGPTVLNVFAPELVPTTPPSESVNIEQVVETQFDSATGVPPTPTVGTAKTDDSITIQTRSLTETEEIRVYAFQGDTLNTDEPVYVSDTVSDEVTLTNRDGVVFVFVAVSNTSANGAEQGEEYWFAIESLVD